MNDTESPWQWQMGVGGVGQGQDGKQAGRMAEAFGSATSADWPGTCSENSTPHRHRRHHQGLFLKCGGGKPLENGLFHAKGL